LELNEEKLIEACKQNKRKARNRLYNLYANQFLGICLRYTRNKTEAEDVLHDSFIKIFTKIDQYTGKGSFEGWMKRIVTNTAIQVIRDRIKDRKIFDENKEFENDANYVEEQNEDLPRLDATELMQIIQDLPDGYRAVFNMFVFEEIGHKEIADILGISEGTSKSQYFRAKQLLRKEIIRRLEEKENR
jgi:RNA polymerase sigma-70 factor (ECF subfamily)